MNIIKRLRKHNGREGLIKRTFNQIPAFDQEFERFHNRLSRFFEEPWAIASRIAPWPAIDMSETEKAVTLRVDVPGIDPKNIEVNVSGNLLSIRGTREVEKKSKDGGTWRHERQTGSFVRTVALPAYVDAGKIEAKYEKGVLTLSAAKIPGAGPKRVAIKAD